MKGLRSSRRQGVLFEDDLLVKTLGNIGTNPEVALTELVANARDAGASRWGALHIRAVLSLADGSPPDFGKGRGKFPTFSDSLNLNDSTCDSQTDPAASADIGK
jgi:hypothetical protein